MLLDAEVWLCRQRQESPAAVTQFTLKRRTEIEPTARRSFQAVRLHVGSGGHEAESGPQGRSDVDVSRQAIVDRRHACKGQSDWNARDAARNRPNQVRTSEALKTLNHRDQADSVGGVPEYRNMGLGGPGCTILLRTWASSGPSCRKGRDRPLENGQRSAEGHSRSCRIVVEKLIGSPNPSSLSTDQPRIPSPGSFARDHAPC